MSDFQNTQYLRRDQLSVRDIMSGVGRERKEEISDTQQYNNCIKDWEEKPYLISPLQQVPNQVESSPRVDVLPDGIDIPRVRSNSKSQKSNTRTLNTSRIEKTLQFPISTPQS